MNRARLIKLIKSGQRFMGWDDDTYRAWLEKQTGKRSCTECSEGELAHLAGDLRANGFQPKPFPRAGGKGANRPTDRQLQTVDQLAKEKGLAGLEDPGLVTLCRRVAKVDNPRFLDRKGVSSLIIALERWVAWDKSHPKPQPRKTPRQPA